jgi:SurA N-terminal domain
VLRRLVKVSAAVVGAGLVVAGCAPIKMGAAAIVGDQRITIATLDTQVTNLSQAASKYPGVVQLNQQQMTQQTLTWLVRFQINEQLAQQHGITVTTAQAQQALAQIYASARAQAAQAGVTNVTLEEVLAANGIPPDLANEVGRYQAIYLQFLTQANGGKLPTSSSSPAVTAFAHAQCQAAKSLNIQVNPQFGQLNYTQLQVVSAPNPVASTKGAPSAGSVTGLAPAC